MPDSKPLASLSSGLLARKGGARPAMRRQNIISPASGDHPAQEDLGWNDMGYDVDPPKNPLPSVESADDGGVDERKAGMLSAAIPEVVKQQDALNRKYADDATQSAEDDNKASATQAAETDNKPVKAPIAISAPSETAGEIQAEDDTQQHFEPLFDASNPGPSPLLRKKGSVNDAIDAPDSGLDSDLNSGPENIFDDISEPPQEQPEKEQTAAHAILSKKPVKKVAAPSEALAAVQPKKQAAAKPQNAAGKRAAFTLRLERERHLRLRLACAIRNQSAQNMVTEALDAFLANIAELDAVTNNLFETAKN